MRRWGSVVVMALLLGLTTTGTAQAAVQLDHFTVHFTAEQVRTAHDAQDLAAFACGVPGEFAPPFVSRICDLKPAAMSDAFTEAFYRGCGVDMVMIDGPFTYDADQRFTVCP